MKTLKDFAERVGIKAREIKFAVGAMAASAAVPVVTVVASAEDPEPSSLSTYASQITNQFTSTASDIIPIIVGVLGAGLTVFAIFVGIKLAKKMFSTVAK
jgi:hypothetical protein